MEFNFGLNGSERFHKNNRWGFFPSVGAAWDIANEKFWPIKDKISSLKLRGSYGIVGNDQIGDAMKDRFFYLSNVNLSDSGWGYTFGELFNYSKPGISINRYPNELIGWEKSKQMNLAIDLVGM